MGRDRAAAWAGGIARRLNGRKTDERSANNRSVHRKVTEQLMHTLLGLERLLYYLEVDDKDINQMTKTALIRLQDEIDAVRREAFAEGFTAAMQSIRDFASRPPPCAELERQAHSRSEAAAPASTTPIPSRRPRRGTNAKLIESVLQSIAPRAARPTEIRNVLRRDRGVALAFTSIRHALGQLEARRVAEHVAHSKSWRYLGDGNSPG